MNRRNFFKGLCALAAAPLALHAKPSRDDAAREANIENLAATDITWVRRLRMLEARMVGNNIQPFPDGLYRGNIGLAVARRLINDERVTPTQDYEFEFGGFRLCVKDDDFLGIQAWGRP